MVTTRVPRRVRWAVDELHVSPSAQILEIGCGSGVAAALVCDHLSTGRLTAIDRSATAIARASARNAANIAAGRARFGQVDLAALSPDADAYDLIFAINVNTFWVRDSMAVRVARALLRPGGRLRLFYEAPGAHRARQVAAAAGEALGAAGFTVTVTPGPDATMAQVASSVEGERGGR